MGKSSSENIEELDKVKLGVGLLIGGSESKVKYWHSFEMYPRNPAFNTKKFLSLIP